MHIQHSYAHVCAQARHTQDVGFTHSLVHTLIKRHHYLAMAIMSSTHLFSTAVPDHKLSSFTLGPDALEVMTM